jgi:hypothetical protein
MVARQLLRSCRLYPYVCCLQSMSVLTALGRILEQHLGYVRDVHYLRLDGSVRSRDRKGECSTGITIVACMMGVHVQSLSRMLQQMHEHTPLTLHAMLLVTPLCKSYSHRWLQRPAAGCVLPPGPS